MSAPKGRRKHPSLLTAFRRPLLIEGIRAGLTKELACQRASLSTATLWMWLKQAREDRDNGWKPWPWDPIRKEYISKPPARVSRELDLLEALEKAESDRLTEALLAIRSAGKGGEAQAVEEVTETAPDGTVRTTKRTKLTQPDWKAFAWLAERTRPNDYGNRVKTVTVEEGTGSDTQEVTSWADLVRIAREGIEQGK